MKMVSMRLQLFHMSAMLVLILLASHPVRIFCNAEGEATEQGECANPDGGDCDDTATGKIRIVTEEELKTKTGAGGTGDIWLSVLGEVYDVTSGRSFYGEGSGYGFFAGKDASPAFATGEFNENAMKVKFEDLTVSQLGAIDGWRSFYTGKPDKYPAVGLLEGYFYDGEGNPTEELKTIRERMASAKSE
mmetsp:Transcript_52244/g.77375  ORF Transcript_52244/g.77375 Transcript_52244/m.77375 type:complete len:189 (+) Transcript_52244:89-655(+)|eukprot:CAMPEP_0195525294 /NCGR_PEP_ID=MMETSP0794_2-20130614/25686_1 /TAXON_ID=515487 /ORGANISM="Stephanopyxis turris, Strain CCMP 815" /LENGTH=188 /DNA_ID=CAMNT_0040655731 /DNA_START=78 /DNA_END=644 /DNA_ORIENTATION=+